MLERSVWCHVERFRDFQVFIFLISQSLSGIQLRNVPEIRMIKLLFTSTAELTKEWHRNDLRIPEKYFVWSEKMFYQFSIWLVCCLGRSSGIWNWKLNCQTSKKDFVRSPPIQSISPAGLLVLHPWTDCTEFSVWGMNRTLRASLFLHHHHF